MTEPRHIQLLPDHVANKIAAGEVVDRPASVLKELIENSLDAGATLIEVEVTAGGRKAIVVSDNGSGMERDDALLSVERHATSKIRDADDLEKISTLGFRGEALAAVSAVAQFTLTTRRAESLGGTEIVIAGGKLQDVRETGCPPGTRIQVRHLFYNIPARRKFLRSEQTELTHVRQMFLAYTLSHPAVGFRLVVDDREVYRMAAASSLEDRLRDIYGADWVKQLRPIQHQAEDITLTGYAGLPQVGRSDRSEQHIFINRRPATAPLLNYAVAEAYHTLLPSGRYPALFLYLEMDPALVDVNIHPAKKEVRFRKSGEVRDAVIEAIRKALATSRPTAEGMQGSAGVLAAIPPVSEPMLAIENLPKARTFSYPRMPMLTPEIVGPESAARQKSSTATDGRKAADGPWSWCRVLGQVGGLYVILETEDGLVLMDPHAAHERVLFEKYMHEVTDNRVMGQGLLTPETVEMSPEDALRVRKHLDLLKKMGFGISDFGGDSFMIDAVPTCLGLMSASSILREVAASLDRVGARGGTERWSEEDVAQAACKAAVKAKDRLTLDEIEQLIVALAGSEMPYTCPHGRPTIIFMSYSELDRKFGRE